MAPRALLGPRLRLCPGQRSNSPARPRSNDRSLTFVEADQTQVPGKLGSVQLEHLERLHRIDGIGKFSEHAPVSVVDDEKSSHVSHVPRRGVFQSPDLSLPQARALLLKARVNVQIKAPDTAARDLHELRSQPLLRSQRRRCNGVQPRTERHVVAAGLARRDPCRDLAVAPELEHEPFRGSLTRVVVADGCRRAAHDDPAQPRGVSRVCTPHERRGQREHRRHEHERAHGRAF